MNLLDNFLNDVILISHVRMNILPMLILIVAVTVIGCAQEEPHYGQEAPAETPSETSETRTPAASTPKITEV